ncbi:MULTISPECIES: helix-turn-helix domain-containing protein [Photorhabdus]|uniref:HTH araC/xylS-type domain-containing protein n=1 Tax=Photorhabdus asymbiotica subsp. asymbiotica (strain ATCC 43949 / 3105-77) TaxID=553480 RepID=C7BT80_PHOAA|nr:conserved hypothetical protein [Photorhabdus asymbiotica]
MRRFWLPAIYPYLSLLEQGTTVDEVVLDIGYSSSSALIAMFQQLVGMTPERFRKS